MSNSQPTIQQTEITAIKQRSTQVVGTRIEKELWHQLEQKCLANNLPMSRILQQAVVDYLKN